MIAELIFVNYVLIYYNSQMHPQRMRQRVRQGQTMIGKKGPRMLMIPSPKLYPTSLLPTHFSRLIVLSKIRNVMMC